MNIIQFVTDSLGDASYLVVANGAAAAVDPQRDIGPYLQAAEEHGVSITHVFETHVHNDYISGGVELAALGATIVAPVGSHLEFPHTPIADGEEIEFGGARLRAVAAPGHTYEHTAYLAIDESGERRGLFTGGAILMGSTGRSDLLGPDHTEELTRLQWESAQRLREFIDESAEVLPTHGAGSFCSTTGAPLERRGPLSIELERNPALTSHDFETFRAIHLAALRPIPGYYRHMAPINRRGPKLYGTPPAPGLLDPERVIQLAATGTTVVDVRKRGDYARGHLPASVNIEESGSMLAYAGWVLPFNIPMALVSYDELQANRVTADFFRIGYEDVRGYLPYDAWHAAGKDVSSTELVGLEEAASIVATNRMPVLDVRFSYEHEASPLAGVLTLPIDQLHQWAEESPDGPALIVCGSGQRAVMAASFLVKHGKQPLVLGEGGAGDIRRQLRELSAAS